LANGTSYTVQPAETLSGITKEQLRRRKTLARDLRAQPWHHPRPEPHLSWPGSGSAGRHADAPAASALHGHQHDTLSGIAKKPFGDANRWPEIFDLNGKAISDPDRIFAGQVLVLPA